MKQTGNTRLMALLLALSLLLAGCSHTASSGGGAGSGTGTGSGGGAPAQSADAHARGGATGDVSEYVSDWAWDDWAGGDWASGDIVWNDVTAGDDARDRSEMMDRTGLMAGEFIEISEEDAAVIQMSLSDIELEYNAEFAGADSLVEEREWSVYTSAIGRDRLSYEEGKFYDRLDKNALKYLRSSMDATRYSYDDGSVYYATAPVQYSDLGLSRTQAQNVAYWFVCNHPQYYFLHNGALVGSGALYPCVFDFAANGRKRAEITNQLFDKLEDWVREVESSASTTYRRELAANKLICESVIYDYDALDASDRGDYYAIHVCQSIYSSVMLEATVCAGYARTFMAIMSALGAEVTAGLNDVHAWNVIHFDDGNYYAVDVCWNDTDREYPTYTTEYINVGEEDLWEVSDIGECHTYGDDLAKWIPAIAEKTYDPDASDSAGTDSITLAAPANLQVVSTGEDTARMTWDPVSGATGYELGLYHDANYSEVSSCGDCAESTVGWRGVRVGSTYYFGVRAVNTDGDEAAYSEWTNITYTHTESAESEAPEAPDAPGNVKMTPNGDGRALLTWDPVAGATSYETCEYTDGTYSQIKADSIYTYRAERAGAEQWYGLRTGETYYMGVRAVKEADGETLYSDWVNLSYTCQG